MSTLTLSFRAPIEFAEQTKAHASALEMNASDYVREAVREKNERAMRSRIAYLSNKLSAQGALETQSMEDSVGDGLGQI